MVTDDGHVHDVVVVGYGPTSQVMALMLARSGWDVAILERWRERYPLPRAVCVDHEMYRMLHAIGLGPELDGVSHPAPVYRWFNAEWKELLAIDWSLDSVSGGSEVNFVHQPTLEQAFDHVIASMPTITVDLGWEAIRVGQTAGYAEVDIRSPDDGTTRTLRGRYLVGADGANSIVRRSIAVDWEDKGFEADWLVLDVLPHDGVDLDIPPAAQWCNPERPTTIVPAGVRAGRFFRRWEFMRLSHETVADLETEDTAWRLLAPWLRPDQATLVRHKVYTFRSRLADKWRDGRLLIAGDAAHVMPPFMGQGMCAGFRDAWNLVWKLDLILRGQAHDRLLDTYQAERRPHVGTIIDMSMHLGKIICMPDAAEAARRDQMFFNGSAPPPPDFPHLAGGLLDHHDDGRLRAPAGRLGPHGHVGEPGGASVRFDEAVGVGFVVVALGPVIDDLGPARRETLEWIGTRIAVIGAGGFQDRDGKYGAFMRRHGIAAMVIRPDFYLYGGVATLDELGSLIERLRTDLIAHGLHEPAAAARPVRSMAG